jgi:hypothetical protein
MFTKVLKFIVRLLPFVCRIYKDAEKISDALDEVDKRSPIKKKNNWRDQI